MDIIYLSGSTIPSGAANSVHVMKMSAAFAKAGHEVTLVARQERQLQNAVSDDPWHYYGTPRSFHLERVMVPSLGVHAYARKALRAFGFSRSVARAIRREKRPDLLYARDLLSVYRLRGLGVPFIYEAHQPPPSPLQALLEARLFDCPTFDRLVVISKALARLYRKQFPGLPANSIVVAHDAADCAGRVVPQLSKMPPAKNTSLNVIYVGHLYEGRGIELMVEVARRSRHLFTFVGGRGADVARWQATNLPQNVRFAGPVPPREVPAWLASGDILIAPYQERVAIATGKDTSQWMSPLKIFEYMAAGRPIVASDLQVLREVLNDEQTALLVTPGDPAAWANALDRLADDVALRRRLARQAFDVLNRFFTWDARAQAVLAPLPRPESPLIDGVPTP